MHGGICEMDLSFRYYIWHSYVSNMEATWKDSDIYSETCL